MALRVGRRRMDVVDAAAAAVAAVVDAVVLVVVLLPVSTALASTASAARPGSVRTAAPCESSSSERRHRVRFGADSRVEALWPHAQQPALA